MTPSLDEIADDIRRHPRLIIADDYELTLQRARSLARDYRNGELLREADDERLVLGLRLIHRRRPGRASVELVTRDSVARLVEAAYESAERSSTDPWFRFPLWKSPKPSPPIAELETPPDSLFPKLNVVPDLFEESYGAWEIHTSLHRKQEKFSLHHSRQVHGARFAMLNHAGDAYFWLREERASGRPLDAREDWLEALLMQSVALTEGTPFRGGGSGFVLMGPQVAARLLARLEPWFHADGVQLGRSPLAGRVGQAIVAPVLSIVDDGRYPDGPRSGPFDMEGSATQETRLVEQGVLKELLHDVYTATKENRLSTGNYLRPPEAESAGIGASQLYVAPSEYRPAELLRAMAEGIILQSLDTLEAVHGSETAFRLSGHGWRVEQGHCVEPLRDIRISFEILDLFERAVEVGNDLAFYGCCGAPSILFENLPLRD